MNINKVVQAIKENNLTVRRLAMSCGVGYATLYDIVHGNVKNPRINTVNKIATYLKIPINDLLNEGDENEKNYINNQKKKKR